MIRCSAKYDVRSVLLQRAAGLRMTHVPVSAGAYFQALAKDDVHMGFMNAASAKPLVQSGQPRGLRRLPRLVSGDPP